MNNTVTQATLDTARREKKMTTKNPHKNTHRKLKR